MMDLKGRERMCKGKEGQRATMGGCQDKLKVERDVGHDKRHKRTDK